MFVEIVVDIQNSEVDKVFDYQTSTFVPVGTRVLVPFGNRKVEGYIISTKDQTSQDISKIKAIISFDKEPVIIPEHLELIDYMSKTYNLKKIDIIRLLVPVGLRNGKIKQRYETLVSLTNTNFDVKKFRSTAKNQIELYNYLLNNKIEKLSILNKKFTQNAVKKLKNLNLLQFQEEKVISKTKDYGTISKKITLTQTQKSIVETISNQKNKYLLFGVTGSGKTEVYMNVIQNMLEKNKTAIMLVPEISLTPQVLKNFKAKFGDEVALLHSGLSQRERFDEWYRIYNGQAKVVVGARSAIFAPIKNIGVIIIDEEHDSSYYSESNPRYSTIEVAKFRAEKNGASLVLGSATPDVESFYKAQIGEYKLLEMPERINKAPMPKFDVVDMLGELRNGNSSIFSRKLIAELCDCVKNGKQAMIYINRRGYQTNVMCRNCGYSVKCEHCDVPLVYHKEDNMLKCHYCDARYHVLSNCPKCGSTDLRYGAIGTQKVVEELKKFLPHAKVFRMDNDNTRSKDAHYNILNEFSNTPSSILVGTQMIAKGHDFPLVTLVGIVDADMGLHFADFRASERTFQLITQVSGRAGRGEYEGKVVLQTYMPKNYTYKCAVNYDYQNFFKHELNIRKVTKFPPFVKILRVLISGDDEQKVLEYTKDYFQQVKNIQRENPQSFVYLNAMKCPVKKIQNKFRYQILMRITQNDYTKVRDLIYNINKRLKSKDVLCFVEVNSQNLS